MTSDKDRELQIELAKLQVEAQFYTAAVFGLVGIVMSVIVLFEALYFTLPPEYALIRNEIPYLTIVLGAPSIIFTWYFLRKILEVQRRIEGLKVTFLAKAKSGKTLSEGPRP